MRVLCMLLLLLLLSVSVVNAKDKPEAASEESASSSNKATKKSWGAMTKEDWDRLEREADEDGDDVAAAKKKLEEPATPAFDPSNPTGFMRASKKGKPSMLFVTVKGQLNRKETEDVAFKWRNLMSTAALEATPYVLENGRILWTVMDGSKGYDVIDFCMAQPETELMEWDSQKYYPATYRREDL